jgi:hypothetical protein
LGDADPVAAAPLADAALTPYHAIKQAVPHLAGGGKYALVARIILPCRSVLDCPHHPP